MSAPAIFPVGPKWIRTNLPWNRDRISSNVVNECIGSKIVELFSVIIIYADLFNYQSVKEETMS